MIHPTVSSILTRLEEKKIIYTEPLETDKRFKRVFLAEKNSEMYELIEAKIASISESAFCGLTEDEQEQFSDMISTFFQAIGKPVPAAVISLCRQIIILIPAVLVFSYYCRSGSIPQAGRWEETTELLLEVWLSRTRSDDASLPCIIRALPSWG
ncbi:hypothetical protein D7V86_18365 [bacterium D16-51]|nr:hypothetical protein D7V96_18010 [bacterium D16-59]RKI57042.1 hypothetical protein D7V86_18365 [bacterium D16-51]